MKIPNISFKKVLKMLTNESVNSLYELDGLNDRAPGDDYEGWIEAKKSSKNYPHVLYVNQINIEQL